MKKYFIYLMSSLFLMNFSVSAQNTCVGVKGGISIPNLSAGGSNDNPLNTGYKSRLGPDLALFADFGISKDFSIRPMIEYSSQGGKKDGMQALPTPVEIAQFFQSQNQQAPPYLYANYKSEAKMNYLMIPILAKFGWNLGHQNHWRIYVDAGPFAGFLLSAHQVESGGQSTLYLDANGTQPIVNPQTEQPIQGNFDTTTNIKSDLHHFNFGLEGNAGIACKINKKNTIFLEGGANYGFLNIQKGTANGKNNTGAGTVTLGYAYCLGKK